MKEMKIAVAGTGYVGLSIATLLAQHHPIVAVDIIPEKVEMINQRNSPIKDEYIERYFAEVSINGIEFGHDCQLRFLQIKHLHGPNRGTKA